MNVFCSPLDVPVCTPPSGLNPDHFRRVLVLVPHPDDETIGCGGLLIALHDLGIPTRIILVTDGSGGGELPEGTAEIRQREFSAALGHLGRNLESECWQLPDGSPGTVTDITERIVREIHAFDASLLVAPWPLDLHPDHSLIGQAAREAHRRTPLEQGILFYEVWSPLPANRLLEIPTEHWERKLAALSCHATALACHDYRHAMYGLASYRSLLSSNPGTRFAEAYYAHDLDENLKKIQFRHARHEDGPQITELFKEVFSTTPPHDWWTWKYGKSSPPGSVALNEQGKIIGFYGALPRKAQLGGTTIPVCQQADVMVSKSHRFATRTQGVFHSLSLLFLSHHVGEKKTYTLSFGFPTERALRLGIRLGLYRSGGRLIRWHFLVNSKPKPPLGSRWSISRASDINDWQWLRALGAPTHDPAVLVLEKTPEYWESRYGHHPSRKYEVIRFSRWGRLIAAIVIQANGHELEIMDIAVRKGDNWHQALHACSLIAQQRGINYLTTWGTECAIRDFPPGETSDAGQLALPGTRLNAPLADQVLDKCWLLGGDTDFR